MVFCVYIVRTTYINIPMLDIENERVSINELYIYGTHLNMEGNVSFIDDVELVLYDGNFITYDINDLGVREDEYDKLIDSSYMGDFDRRFNLSDYVNDGLYLDNIPLGDYYLFLRSKYMDGEEEKYKYYALDNKSGYDDTTYYTISNFNKKIVIENEDKYPTMMMHVDKNKDDNVDSKLPDVFIPIANSQDVIYINDDISSMSTAQICMISMILSFSLLFQSSRNFSMPLVVRG